jgi:hypothetical protein
MAVFENNALDEIAIFIKLASVEGDLSIQANPNLSRITGFDLLSEVGGTLNIIQNYDLPTCDAISINDQLTVSNGVCIIYNDSDICDEITTGCP